jgi:hypothetical protein
VTTTTGTAVSLNSVGGNFTFTSISSNGGSNGIVLSNATGSFSVTGDGATAGSGGTLQNMTGADNSSATPVGTSIVLNNAQNVSLAFMHISSNSNYGIRGASVTGLTLDHILIDGQNGNNEASPFEEGSIRIDNLFGIAAITNSDISGGYDNNVLIRNSSGTLNRLTIDHTHFGLTYDSNTNGGSSIIFEGPATASAGGTTMNLTVSNSTFDGSRGAVIIATSHGASSGTASMDVSLVNNTITNIDTHILSGATGMLLEGGDNGVSDFTFNVSGNQISTTASGGAKGAAINIYEATNSFAGTVFNGTVANNVIGKVAVAASGAPNSAPALWIQAHGAGTYTTLIQGNSITQYGEEAIDLQRTQGSGTLNASLFANTVTNPDPLNAFAGLNIEQGALSSDSGTMNLVIGSATDTTKQNDFSNGDPNNVSDIQVLRAGSSTTVLNLSKNGSASSTVTNVLKDDNANPANTVVFIPTTGNMNLVTTLPATPVSVTLGAFPASSAQVGTAYNAANTAIAASGGTSPYTFSIVGGALPAGLSLSSAGVLSGTPTASGSFSFTIGATDSSTAKNAGTRSYTMTVSAPAANQIVLSPASLNAGTVGTAYSQTITASGSTAPFHFAISAGALPPGLVLV